MDFKECHRLLSHLGAKPVLEHEYRGPNGSRKKFDLDLFTGVTLPFSCDEWCALCMNGGSDYLGGCCGSLSAVQDRLNATFRGDGYITTHHLKEIIEILNEHGDLDSEHYPLTLEASRLQEVSQKALDDWYDLGVLEKLAVIWHLVKDHMTSRIPTSSPEEGGGRSLDDGPGGGPLERPLHRPGCSGKQRALPRAATSLVPALALPENGLRALPRDAPRSHDGLGHDRHHRRP